MATGAGAPKFGITAPGAGGFKASSFTAPKLTAAAGGVPAAATGGTTPKFGNFAAKPAAGAVAPGATAGSTTGAAAGAAPAATTTAVGGTTVPKFGGGAAGATAPKFGIGAKPATATTPTGATTAPTTATGAAAGTVPKFGITGAKPTTSVSITPAAGAANAATAASTTPGAATTATGAAAASTAPKIGLGLGAKPAGITTGTSAATTTTGTTAAAGAAKAPVVWKPTVDIPALLKGKTLEEMINEWSAQIDADIFQFTQMAMLVGEWDKKVSSNSKKILDLKQKVDLVESAQSELNKNLELITAQQAQLAQVLTALESSVEKWSLTVDFGPQDAERERGYALADDIDVQLNQMSFKLKEMIDRLNASQERASAKEGDSPAFQILQILDSHLNSLAWIDNTSAELGAKLGELQAQFSRRPSSSMNTEAYSLTRYY